MSSKSTVDILGLNGIPVGCKVADGKIVPSLECVFLNETISEDVIFAGHSEATERFFLCANSGVYVSGNNKTFVRISPYGGNKPFMAEDIIDGTARALIISGDGAVVHSGSSYTWLPLPVPLYCGVVHSGRLFGAVDDGGLKIAWIDLQNAGVYGSVILDPARGAICDVLEMGEKLVFVRKYGLTTADMFGLTENFSVNITDTDTDEIIAGTAKVAGGKLLFFTASGLHCYDGSSVRKINHRCEEDISDPSCAVCFGSAYYVRCQSKQLEGTAIMCYDVSDGESFLIDAQPDAMCAADGVYIYNADGVFRLEKSRAFRYVSDAFCFGNGSVKTVVKLFVGGAASAVKLSNGRVSRRFINAYGTIRAGLRGKRFSVEVAGSSPISGLTATAEARNEI